GQPLLGVPPGPGAGAGPGEGGMKGRILIVEDDAAMRALLEQGLTRRDFEVRSGKSAAEALDQALDADAAYDVVLTDLNMPGGMSGVELCRRIADSRPDLPVVVLTAFGSLETATASIRAGAYDFVTKPVELDALTLVLERAVSHRRLRDEVHRLRRAVAAGAERDLLAGESLALRRALELIDRGADSDATVLVTGESGTGKELAARALHDRGKRSAGPFIAINCAAMPEALLESELFGHVRGAFTDARSHKTGLLVEAHGGTLFLDEIGELPVGLQPKLLRALQERKVRPVGANAEVSFDARVVAATNRGVEALVHEGGFREDLYFRLNVIGVELPPLRARGNDVLLLAQRFTQHFAARSGKKVIGFQPEVAKRLLAYSWPGNVRELQNCIERAVAVTSFDQLGVDDLPEKIREGAPAGAAAERSDGDEIVPLAEVEKRHILKALDAFGGNRTLAARALGLDRKTLYRKLEQYRVEAGDPKGAAGGS
ncbi:MAG TPA: sigma-54 dependent transcriptional regulator, partial [Myxococcaceae bacterium]